MVSAQKQRQAAAFVPKETVKRTHDWVKDDEELELEAQLFGTSKKRSKGVAGFDAGEGGEANGGLEDVDDSDLFMVDAPVIEVSEDEGESDEDGEHGALIHDGEDSEDEEEEELEEEEDEEDEEEESDSEGSDSGVSIASSSAGSAPSIAFDDTEGDLPSNGIPASASDLLAENGADVYAKESEFDISFPADLVDIPSRSPSPESSRKGKAKSVWNDPSDETLLVDLASNKRLKKLGRGKQGGGANGKEVNGKQLEERLREQFERLHPRPEWASKRTVIGTPSISSLLSSTKSFIAGPSADIRPALPQGNIEVQRMVNANHQNPTASQRENQGAGRGVVDVVWHPNERVSVMAVVGGDRRVRFFNIDGHTNPTLLTIFLPGLPLTNASFHPSGSSLLLTGIRPYYYTYDLASSKCIRSPRNLFGSTPSPSSPNSLGRHKFSPDGTLLAVAGRRGVVSILDWSGVGAGAVLAELKSGRGGTVADMSWSYDGKELSVLGGRDGAEVEIWDIGSRRVVGKWRDDRVYGGSIMGKSYDGQYTAIGSSTGIVNLYSTSSLRDVPSAATGNAGQLPFGAPEPLKSLEHLTSAITTVAFHPSNEILMTASNTRKARMKLYHLPTGTAFANWPTSTAPLGRINTASFSTSGEYLAAGNQRGNVVLYRLKHYMK